MTTWNLCSTPPGYSERWYTGRYPDNMDNPLYGYVEHDPDACELTYLWPRNSSGAPSYARIDFTRPEQISEPDFTFPISGEWGTGNFSWGTALIGLGSPGPGDDFLVGPRMYVGLTGDNDTPPSAGDPKFIGTFTNAAGTSFSTAWTVIQPHGQVFSAQLLNSVEIRMWIVGSTGYVQVGDVPTIAVPLSGSFLGDWGRWEMWHGGGGGSGSNAGGTGEGDQTATGRIHSVTVAGVGTVAAPLPLRFPRLTVPHRQLTRSFQELF